MIDNRLRSFAEARGLAVVNDYILGVVGGYTVLFELGFNQYDVTFETESNEEFLLDSIEEYKLRDELFVSSYVVINSNVCFHIPVSEQAVQCIDNLCMYYAARLDMLGAKKPRTHCENCGADTTATHGGHYIIDGQLKYLDDSCAQALGGSQKREKVVTGSIFIGLIGAILGALVGAIPWALLYYFGVVSMWCGALIGLASAYGYTRLGGKSIPAVKIILVSLCTIIAIIAVNWGIMYAVTLKELHAIYPDASLSFSSFYDLVTSDKSTSAAILADTVLSLFFGAGGLVLFFLVDRKKRKAASEMDVSNFLSLND